MMGKMIIIRKSSDKPRLYLLPDYVRIPLFVGERFVWIFREHNEFDIGYNNRHIEYLVCGRSNRINRTLSECFKKNLVAFVWNHVHRTFSTTRLMSYQ